MYEVKKEMYNIKSKILNLTKGFLTKGFLNRHSSRYFFLISFFIFYSFVSWKLDIISIF